MIYHHMILAWHVAMCNVFWYDMRCHDFDGGQNLVRACLIQILLRSSRRTHYQYLSKMSNTDSAKLKTKRQFRFAMNIHFKTYTPSSRSYVNSLSLPRWQERLFILACLDGAEVTASAPSDREVSGSSLTQSPLLIKIPVKLTGE